MMIKMFMDCGKFLNDYRVGTYEVNKSIAEIIDT